MIKERTCVVCRKKVSKERLFRFSVLSNEIVIDIKHGLKTYGYYICREDERCMPLIDKWLKKKKKIKRLDDLDGTE